MQTASYQAIPSHLAPHVIYKDGYMYLASKMVYNNLVEALRLAYQLVSAPQAYQPVKKTQQASPKYRKHTTFKWGATQSDFFAVASQAIGIANVKPRELMRVMPKQWQLDCAMIGSHLQKYRLTIRRDHQLDSADGITNELAPHRYRYHVLIKKVIEQWYNPRFGGFTEDYILEMLRQIDIDQANSLE